MRQRLRALVAVFLGVWILACAGLGDLSDLEAALKPTPPPSDAWVGVWEGPGHSLIIAADGTVELRKREGGTSQNVTAPAKDWTGGITIGIGPISNTWTVEQPPHEVDGEWRMVFDGEILVRKGPPPAGFGIQTLGLDPEIAAPPPVPAVPDEPEVEEPVADSEG